MTVKLLTDLNLEFLSLKGGCKGSSGSTLVKCHIVGNHMSWLICTVLNKSFTPNNQFIMVSLECALSDCIICAHLM